jgi:dipeptidyl aminopeptidase/acylaminoacyl peptidase
MGSHLPKIATASLIWVTALAALASSAPALGQTRGQNGQPGQPSQAFAKRPITFADLTAMKRVGDPQISPSGRWVLFSVTDVSLEKNTKTNHLWVVPLAGGPNPSPGTGRERQLTSNTGESFGRFSPNGQFVSYTGEATKDDPVSRITIATWDDATGTIGVGRTLKAVSGDADGAIWSPDSKHFLFTTQVYPECSIKGGIAAGSHAGGSSEATKSSVLDTAIKAGSEPAAWAEEDACDKAKDDAAGKDPVKAQIWDGLLYRHWNAYTGEKRTHIILADFSLDGANPRDLTPASDVGDAETPTFFLGAPIQYAWAPDSKEIAYVTNLDAVPAASTNNDVFTLRLNEQAEPVGKPVKISTSPGSDDAPAYSPDGKYLAFRSQARAGFESDRFRLMLFDRKKKTTNELLPKFDSWVDEFVWDGTRGLYFVSPRSGEEDIFFVGARGTDAEIEASVRLVRKGGEFSSLNELPINRPGRPEVFMPDPIVAVKMSADRPSEVVLVYWGDEEGGHRPGEYGESLDRIGVKYEEDSHETILTSPNDALLKQLSLTSLEDFWFAGAEGTKVQGFIVRPPNFDPSKKYPLKFLMHGGPQTAWGDSWSYRWNWQLMAAGGYVVIGINRRGSTGYGQKFVDEVSGDWGGKAYTDLMRGLDYAETKFPFIDKTRECALGASYGGYMADWVLTHTNRFQCIVTHDGMYDAVSAYGATEEMWFNEWEFRRSPSTGATAFDSKPAAPWRYSSLPAAQDPFRKWSPSQYIQNAKTPTLIIHSQKDYRLDVSQGFELFTALQRLGVPSKFLYFPDEGHWVLKPKNSELWYQTVGDWCDRWTQSGKYAAP